MKRKIYKKLYGWCKRITRKYGWLTVKFEFSDRYDTYLVSFYPSSIIENSDQFNIDAMAFEDKMNDQFGDMAPLFCDEESCFKLSNKAKVFGVNIQEFEHYDSNISFSWSPSEIYIPLELDDCDGFYSLAA